MHHKILIVCPSMHDKAELMRTEIYGSYQLYFHEYDEASFDQILVSGKSGNFDRRSPHHVINELMEICNSEGITAVFSSDDYPGSIYASILAYHYTWPGAHPAVLVGCQHKYIARRHQQRLVPEATPSFEVLNQSHDSQVRLPFPFFIKPVKSYFSYLAKKISHEQELAQARTGPKMPDEFLYQFNWFLQYTGYEPESNMVLAEELLEGHQVTLEGYIHENDCVTLGITDSIMYPGTMSFMRFQYPSMLSDQVQLRMHDIACRLMKGIGFNNSFFNIEMMYDPQRDKINIIEVNPRQASQFADLYEKVDGTSSYRLALELATGIKPTHHKNKGQYAIAASCVLRLFENKKVIAVPDNDALDQVKDLFADSRVFVCIAPGQYLSDNLQDGNSYMYCLIHLGAESPQDLEHKLKQAQQMLPFEFASL